MMVEKRRDKPQSLSNQNGKNAESKIQNFDPKCHQDRRRKMENAKYKFVKSYNFRHNTMETMSSWVYKLVFLILFVQSTKAQDDRRCFLERGSVQNFFVSESLPVGYVIGELDILGDASEDGDIYLRLETPQNASIQITPNSKRIVLTEKLDKEGKNGRSHIALNVICQKRKADDVDTKIPINIRVTDANDNPPIFINSPYYVNVSEATVVDTIIKGDIGAFDEDQIGPFSEIRYYVAPGPYSSKFAFESSLSGSLQLKEPLDYETNPLFNITIVAEDRGSPPMRTETFVTVQVLDSDDQNPLFGHLRYMAFLPRNPVKGSVFEVQPDAIYAKDQDKGINARIFYTLGNDVPEASFLGIEPNSGELFLTKDVPEDTFPQPVALSVIATQVDNKDRTGTAILTISRRGTATTQLQFLQPLYEKTLNENLPRGTPIANTLVNAKLTTALRFSLEKGGMGKFVISKTGQIFLDSDLDYETQKEYTLNIYVTDGEYNDTAVLKVTVLNVNDWDPRFQYPQYVFYVKKDTLKPGDTVGSIQVADGDGDEISLTVRGRDARMFSVSPAGEITVRRIVSMNTTEANIILVAKDSGKPPRQNSVSVIINLPQKLVGVLPIDMSSSFLLMVVFGSLVAIFVLVIICLAVYIHKNKKYRDDNDAALPTKMNPIVRNGTQTSKLDPISTLSHQQDAASDITGVEAPRSNGSILEANNAFKRGYTNGSLRASTISVRSTEPNLAKDGSSHDDRQYSRNPLANAASFRGRGLMGMDGIDSLSLNGSNATTTSTATSESDSSLTQGSRSSTPITMTGFLTNKSSTVVPTTGSVSSFCTLDGTARATGGLPNSHSNNPHIRPVPAHPGASNSATARSNPANAFSKSISERPSTSSGVSSDDKFISLNSLTGVEGKKICWPPASIPKKVKKLSWEDELNSQTELNPEVSVMPLPNPTHREAPNLTVYF